MRRSLPTPVHSDGDRRQENGKQDQDQLVHSFELRVCGTWLLTVVPTRPISSTERGAETRAACPEAFERYRVAPTLNWSGPITPISHMTDDRLYSRSAVWSHPVRFRCYYQGDA